MAVSLKPTRQISRVPGVPAESYVYFATAVLVAGAPQVLDLTAARATGYVDAIRGVKLDNTANGTACSLFSPGGDFVYCPPYSWVMCPFAISDGQQQLQMQGNGTVNVVLMNYQTPTLSASVQLGSAPVNGAGAVPVSDGALEALISTGALKVAQQLLGNGDVMVPPRAADAVYSGSITTATTTSLITGSPSFFLSAIDIAVSGYATLATAGNLTLTLKTAGGITLMSRNIALPATAPTISQALPNVPVFAMSGMSLAGAPAGDSLQLTTSAALATGGVYWTAVGGLTAIGG